MSARPASRTAAPGNFRVQLGSFAAPDIADLGAGQLREQYADLLADARLEVVKASLPDRGDVWRIVTAPANFETARALCEELKGRGADCLPIRLP